MTWKERVTRRAEALTSRSSPVSSILADVPNSEMKRKFTLECKVQIKCLLGVLVGGYFRA